MIKSRIFKVVNNRNEQFENIAKIMEKFLSEQLHVFKY